MKLHFPKEEVARLLEHCKNAPETNTLYNEVTGRGLWLVGDQGVYLMSNGSPHMSKSNDPEDKGSFVSYAVECNPELEFDEWYDNKRHSFGGDDGAEFLALEALENGFKNTPDKKGRLTLDVTPTGIGIVESVPVCSDEEWKVIVDAYTKLCEECKSACNALKDKLMVTEPTAWFKFNGQRNTLIGKANRARKMENKTKHLQKLLAVVKAYDERAKTPQLAKDIMLGKK